MKYIWCIENYLFLTQTKFSRTEVHLARVHPSTFFRAEVVVVGFHGNISQVR